MARGGGGPTSPQTGLIPKLLRFVSTVIFFLFVALFFSLVLEWTGMTFFWPDEKIVHAKKLYEKEITFISTDFQTSLISDDSLKFAVGLSQQAYELLFEKTGILNSVEKAVLRKGGRADGADGVTQELFRKMADYVVAAVYVVKTFMLRVAILTMAIPLFVMFAFVGLTDGLVQRDIRRWSGGRESSLVYSYSKNSIGPIFYLTWVVYLAMPVSVHPSFILFPFACIFGFAIAMTASAFKKYL